MKSQVKSTTTCAALSFWIKVLLLVLLFFLCSLLIASSILATFTTPKFDKEVIRNIAEKAVGLGREEAFHNISKQLQTVYPQLITDSSEWIFINAGGWMGSFYLLHASLTEYVLLFGTAIETSGHSGRYWIDIYDTLIRGTFQQWSEGTTYYVTYSPGDTIYHPRLSATAVRWKEDTWMLEYAHGPILSSFLFALSDSLFSTLDWLTIYKSMRVYSFQLLRSLFSTK
ncbi:hypothetical protein GAYE_SCF17G3780 [Galdieria yellowstonensis]|uniref:C-8 sterol isomerase n=1 Tax=Galdieria yellowstonensis TaxID=3028027 RepID=A0AAV9IF42_9RHOD|nr:hypothetical protein GAYE_SCF17G3780 [Galdieria yellowstonensis]